MRLDRRTHFLLTIRSLREDAVEILNDIFVRVAFLTEERSHLLVLHKLILGDTQSLLDRISVKDVTMVNTNHLGGLGGQ